MMETSQNAGDKMDAVWSQFLEMLDYKGDLHGTHVIPVDARGTTKECNACSVETEKPIRVREHSCPACGHEEDRDLNAAKNVLDRGINALDVGAGRSESTAVQTVLPAFASIEADAKRVVETGSPEARPRARFTMLERVSASMPAYEVEVPEGPERGIRVACPQHGEAEEFQPGYRTVAFHCPGCGFELEVSLHDLTDSRAWDERC